MRKKKPIVALIYDFDGTLSPGNMQEYDFRKAIGVHSMKQFWAENARWAKEQNASEILSYMRLMIEKSHEKDSAVTKQTFENFGKSIELYPGVEEWFDLVNQLGTDNGVTIEHYLNSSGLKEMVEGTSIAKKFQEIYACSFMYDENGAAKWPAVAVDFTAKTQFLFMINKGIAKIYDNKKVNEFMPKEERPIPFDHMIYFGDGNTDIPCMKLVKQQGGNSIAVYKPRSKKKKAEAEKLIRDGRVNFACKADYTKGSEVYQIVEAIIRQIKSKSDFDRLQEKNHSQIIHKEQSPDTQDPT